MAALGLPLKARPCAAAWCRLYFELLTEGGPWVQVADSGSIRRVNFDLYEISSRNPAEGARARPSLIGGKPHRHERFVTDRPWEAFAALWEMNDECYAHWLEGHERDLRAQAERLGIMGSDESLNRNLRQ